MAIRDNCIVLMHKHIPSYFNYNKLTPPGGGLEPGETLEEGCIRELHEETGLWIAEPELRGVMSYINYGNRTQNVTMLFYTNNVQGELAVKEPEKHTPEWVELDTIDTNERVPDYYRAIIRHLLTGQPLLNARLEWNKPGAMEAFTWTIVKQ
jgi:8-oxo-dGTP diphosphatase